MNSYREFTVSFSVFDVFLFTVCVVMLNDDDECESEKHHHYQDRKNIKHISYIRLYIIHIDRF